MGAAISRGSWINYSIVFPFSCFSPHHFFFRLPCAFLISTIGTIYALSQIQPFKTVGVYPLVGLEISLVDGSKHSF